MSTYRIIIVEDQTSALEGLCAFLESKPFEVVGTAKTADEALSLAKGETFDAAIVDIELVRFSHYPHGFEIAETVRAVAPAARIVFWTAYGAEGDLIRRAARPVGTRFLADALVSKDQPLITLAETVEFLCRNPSVKFMIDESLEEPAGYSAVEDLTPAEDRWIRAFAQRAGARPRDLQAELGIKEGAYLAQRRSIATKVVKELEQRHAPLFAELTKLDVRHENDLPKLLRDEHLLQWARQRCLHWPITASESEARISKRRPNE